MGPADLAPVAEARFVWPQLSEVSVRVLLRKLRGMLGVGLTWGTIWAALGVLLGLVVGAIRPQDVDPGETPSRIALILGIAGFISGASFGLMLTLVERGRTLLDVSLARVAVWGAAGAAVVPLLTGVSDSQVMWTCPLGAVLAATSVTIARRAERRQIIPAEADIHTPTDTERRLSASERHE